MHVMIHQIQVLGLFRPEAAKALIPTTVGIQENVFL